MKKMTKVLGFLAFVSIAVLAGRAFTNPTDAAVACPQVQNYLKAGFTLDEVTPNQFRYIMEPTGTYAWGTVTLQLHGRTGGPYSLETTYATVTCQVEARQQGGTTKFVVTSTEVYENVVY
jgi:hypothetical protein